MVMKNMKMQESETTEDVFQSLEDGRLEDVLNFGSLISATSAESIYEAKAKNLAVCNALGLNRGCNICSQKNNARGGATRGSLAMKQRDSPSRRCCLHNMRMCVKISYRAVRASHLPASSSKGSSHNRRSTTSGRSSDSGNQESSDESSPQRNTLCLHGSGATKQHLLPQSIGGRINRNVFYSSSGNSDSFGAEQIGKSIIVRAEHEARALAHADGEGVPLLFWFGKIGTQHAATQRAVTIMERLEGPDALWMFRRSAGRERDAKMLTRAALGSLSQLHSKGIAHGAVDASNLVCREMNQLLSSCLVDLRRAQIRSITCNVEEWNICAQNDIVNVGLMAQSILKEPEMRSMEWVPGQSCDVPDETSRIRKSTTHDPSSVPNGSLEESNSMVSLPDDIPLSTTGKHFLRRTLSSDTSERAITSAELALSDVWVSAIDGAIEKSQQSQKKKRSVMSILGLDGQLKCRLLGRHSSPAPVMPAQDTLKVSERTSEELSQSSG